MRHVLTQDGYTFVDAILQLLVLLLFSQLILFYSVWFKQVEKHFFQSEPIEWELFSLEIENNLFGVTAIEEQVSQTGIRFVKNGAEYDIECYPSLIRKQRNRSGHEPMLIGVRKCKFQLLGDQVLIDVEFANGRKEARVYEVYISQE